MAELCFKCGKNEGKPYGVVCGKELSSTLVDTQATSTGVKKTYQKEYRIAPTVYQVVCDKCIARKKMGKTWGSIGIGLLLAALVIFVEVTLIYSGRLSGENVDDCVRPLVLIAAIAALVLLISGIFGFFESKKQTGENILIDWAKTHYHGEYDAFWQESVNYPGKK